MGLNKRVLPPEAILDSRNILHVLRMLPDAVLMVDARGRAIFWNKAMEDLTGVKAKDILGKGNHELGVVFYGIRRPVIVDFCLNPRKEIAKHYKYIRREGGSIVAQSRVPNYKGRSAYLWIKATPIHDEKGTLIGAIELVREISKLKNEIDVQRRFLQRVTQIRDEETRRLAGNLHDEVGSLTVVVNCGLRILEEKLKSEQCPGSIRLLTKFRSSMEEVISSFKNISREFMPIDVEKSGLIPALRKYFKRVREYAKLRVDFTTNIKNRKILDVFKVVLYRLIQESVNNTIKHAQADRIKVSLNVRQDTVVLVVSDNGKGFDIEKAEEGIGMGMQIIKSRVESLGGELNIRSFVRQGTTIRVKLPLNREPEPWL